MARILLSEAGAAAGARFLPNGLNILGRSIGGATIGRAAGAMAGNAIDTALFSPVREGPRLKSLHLTESREGAAIPNVYGRARVGGQLVWAARFRETRREEGGGKGGPQTAHYAYSLSFAVAICEGEIQRVDRVWANGEALSLGDCNHRLYRGSETQEPDPLIEAIEGAGFVPAYRGLAYIVFEDLPLERFGNRVPQFSFEVSKSPPVAGGNPALGELVKAVNIIPASGEFVYARDVIRTRRFPGIEKAVNANTHDGRADFVVSVDQLCDAFPGLESAALTVGWFGSDLRAEECLVRPGVETREKTTVPWSWEVCGVARSQAPLVSGAEAGEPNYGGTPADRAVIQGIETLKVAGIAVTLSPFLFMDIPPANGLPDPYGGDGQAVFPWRGRITSLSDASPAARDAVAAFMGEVQPGDFSLDGQRVIYSGPAGDWGYRRFVLHMAMLGLAAGGVEAFLLGSELRGLTRLRDSAGQYPFVAALVALAEDVRRLVGPLTKISYGADWTEYGAHATGDGSGDVMFPLDPLWAHDDIDFVGIDWYPPMGDWRDGEAHLDALAGFAGPDDGAYLRHNFEGGEAYDWYYADAQARDAQVRTPIRDTAHGEDWIFRAKDLDAWWRQPHHERPAGVRNTHPTGWVAESKPVRFCEIGFPAVDKGGNSPNLFFDPKSSESALPPYSSGARDDVFQSRALVSALGHFENSAAVESAFVWAWDGRPFPAWPTLEEIWSDGENWQRGHWLNGRTGLSPLCDLVSDLCARAGVDRVVCSAVNGLVEGLAFDGVFSLRAALEPFEQANGLEVRETQAGLGFQTGDAARRVELDGAALVEPGVSRSRDLMDKSPGRVQLAYADLENGYQPAVAEARAPGGDPRDTRLVQLPLSLSRAAAERLAEDLLARSQTRRSAELAAGPAAFDLAPGDRLAIARWQEDWKVESVEYASGTHRLTLSGVPADRAPVRAAGVPVPEPVRRRPASAELVVIDAPRLPGSGNDPRPLIAAAADPWPGAIDVEAGTDPSRLGRRARIETPARIGRLVAPLAPGPVGRWDRAARIELEMSEAALSGRSRLDVLAGSNALLVQGEAGWELLGFVEAELTGPRHYRLRRFLRGLGGSDPAAEAGAPSGAIAVLVDEALVRGEIGEHEIALPLTWRAGDTGLEWTQVFNNAQGLPWQPAHLRVIHDGNDPWLNWMARGPQFPDNWQLPDPRFSGTFEVEWMSASVPTARETVTGSAIMLAQGADGARVRELADDGRAGPWASILSFDR